MLQRFDNHLRPNPRRIAHSDANDRKRHSASRIANSRLPIADQANPRQVTARKCISLAARWGSPMSAPSDKTWSRSGARLRQTYGAAGPRPTKLAIGYRLSIMRESATQSPLRRFVVLSTLPALTRSLRPLHWPWLVRRYALLPGHVCSQAEIRSRR